jgi:hypothetical protein
MRTLILATASVLVLGVSGAEMAYAADKAGTAPTTGPNMPAASGTPQSSQTGANSPKMPSSLPPSADRPTGSMTDPPLASPPAANLGSSTAPDK